MAHLTFETTGGGGSAVVALAGELDLSGAAALERELERLADEGVATVVLDLRGVEFMDSSGLRVVALAAQRAQDRGHRFALVPGTAQVMRVFEITRMRERLEFVEDPREVSGES